MLALQDGKRLIARAVSAPDNLADIHLPDSIRLAQLVKSCRKTDFSPLNILLTGLLPDGIQD